MDVSGHPVPIDSLDSELWTFRENQRGQCVEDSEANRSTSAVPYLPYIASTTSGWSLHSLEGGFRQERKSATMLCGRGRYMALRLEKARENPYEVLPCHL